MSLILAPGMTHAKSHKKASKFVEKKVVSFTEQDILKSSQISYKADGGFTGVRSYGVIISCVNGKISTLKSIHDPRRHEGALRQNGTMNTETYLRLWQSLKKQNAFQAKNVAEPKLDITDELTIEFEARVGTMKNDFKVHGITRPEASQHYAIKSIIDSAVQMQAFAGSHEKLALK